MYKWSDEQLSRLALRYRELALKRRPLLPSLSEEFEQSEGSIRWQIRKLRDEGVIGYYDDYSLDEQPVEALPKPNGILRLFWDIETVPNVGVFWKATSRPWLPYDNIVKEKRIVCIAYKWEGEAEVQCLDWGDGTDAGITKMLEEFWQIAEQADELVGHNIDKFDLKWVNSEFLRFGLPPLTAPKTFDTYVAARRRFYLNSNRLDYLHKILFDSTGKDKKPTFEVWKSLAVEHDDELLQQMVEYCKQDIQLLEDVFNKVVGFHGVKSHVGVLNGGPKWSCAHCASESVRRKKRRVTAKGTVQHSMVCKDCHNHYTISNTEYSKFKEGGST